MVMSASASSNIALAYPTALYTRSQLVNHRYIYMELNCNLREAEGNMQRGILKKCGIYDCYTYFQSINKSVQSFLVVTFKTF